MRFQIDRLPHSLVLECRKTPERAAWLAQLPHVVRELQQRWSLTIDRQFDAHEASCAWIVPVTIASGMPAILKLGMPHMEGEHEIAGLRFWNGEPTVRLLDADEHLGAMLIERCDPGTSLRHVPEIEQDVVIADLLRRLWRPPVSPHPFRPLSTMLSFWREETLAELDGQSDVGLVNEGLRLFDELSCATADDVVLATDLHAGNVLRALRQSWLVIDPKPFVGDRAYDLTQHLLNCARLQIDPHGTIRRLADLLEVDGERVRLWTFARLTAGPRDARDATRDEWMSSVAKSLAGGPTTR